MTALVAPSTVSLPESHLDLLIRPICGVFTTLGPDGQPQSSLVWVDVADTARFIQIRGDAELVTDGAVDHLDALTRKYTRHPRFYGCIYPSEQRARETRVICRIHARRITLDAIHA